MSTVTTFEAIKEAIESGPTASLYVFVKNAAASIPHGPLMVEKSILGITMLTEFINDKTSSNIAIFDMETSLEQMNNLDSILADQCILMDDGFDSLRASLAGSLRKLMSSVAENRQLLEQRVSSSLTSISSAVLAQKVHAQTRFERAQEVCAALLASVQEIQPYEAAKELTQEACTYSYAQAEVRVEGCRSAATAYCADLLREARPYVHNAVHRSSPYVAQAVEVSQPYVVRASPYLAPLVERAQAQWASVHSSVQGHAVLGAYASRAEQLLQQVVLETKAYCSKDEAEAEVAGEVAVLVEGEKAVEDVSGSVVVESMIPSPPIEVQQQEEVMAE